MEIYWCIFLFLLILALSYTANIKLQSIDVKIQMLFYTLFAFICLVFFAGFRLESNDYENYLEIFKEIPNLSKISSKFFFDNSLNVEYGFVFLNSLVKTLTNNVVFFMLIIALIAVSLNFYVILKISPFIFLSIVLYYVHPFLLKETIQIRQGLASALVLLAIYYNKKTYKFILFILLAASIQSTAYVCLLFSPLVFKEYKVKWLILILFFTFGFSTIFSGKQFLDLVLTFMQLPNGIMYYLGWDIYDFKLGFFSPVLLKQLFILFFLFLKKIELSNRFDHFTVLFNFYFISILWYIYFNDFAIVAARVSNIMSVGEIILIPMLLTTLNLRNQTISYILVLLLCGLILFLNLQSSMIFPYKNVLFN